MQASTSSAIGLLKVCDSKFDMRSASQRGEADGLGYVADRPDVPQTGPLQKWPRITWVPSPSDTVPERSTMNPPFTKHWAQSEISNILLPGIHATHTLTYD